MSPARCYYARDSARYLKQKREWERQNPERRNAILRRYRKGTGRFKEALRNSRRAARKHGHLPCTATEAEIRAAFTGRCHNRACNVAEKDLAKALCLDHNHMTGEFRGWLCARCNRVLGYVNDSKLILDGLLAYLGENR